MIEPNYMDDMDMDFCGDFFDQIDDLLDFPSEDVEGGDVVGGDCNNAFQGIWPPPSDSLAGSGSIFSGNSTNNTSELPTELPVPHEDIAQLEWLSNFVEDSFSAGSITLDEDSNIKNTTTTTTNHSSDSHQFRTSSPVSVLESSSSCSGGKIMPLSPKTHNPPKTHIPVRARTKRPRPATFNSWPALPLISPTSSVTEPTPPISTSEFENFAESHPLKKIPKPDMSEQKKMKKKKKKLPPLQSDTDHFDLQQQQQQTVAVRKCLHCEITKTPQWRAGPLGPKTLCNACGVRYKSGRLFPEYRPAASPTFVPSLHSNSHKKVQEMRTKGAQNMAADMPQFMPRSSHLPDYI